MTFLFYLTYSLNQTFSSYITRLYRKTLNYASISEHKQHFSWIIFYITCIVQIADKIVGRFSW